MDIMQLGAIGEFVGSLGVIVTLVYVGIQIRQNTKAIKGGAARESLGVLTAVQIPLYTTTQAATVFSKGLFE